MNLPKPNGTLTPLIEALQMMETERIKQATPEAMAGHYGVNPEHVAGYQAMELRMRGVRI